MTNFRMKYTSNKKSNCVNSLATKSFNTVFRSIPLHSNNRTSQLNYNFNIKLNISSTTEIRDYFQCPDLATFCRRVGGIDGPDSSEDAREIRKLIPNNPPFFSAQIVARKKPPVKQEIFINMILL